MKTLTSSCVETLPSTTDLLSLHQQWPAEFPFYLQSAVADAGQNPNARYDILFAFPRESITLEKSGKLILQDQIRQNADFLSEFDQLWRAAANTHSTEAHPDIPFRGGWFVYLGYELAGQIEPRLNLPASIEDIPVAMASRIPAAILNDHLTGQTIFIAEKTEDLARLKELHSQRKDQQHPPTAIQLSTTEEDECRYLDGVERVKQYIVDGDVFQVNLSRAWYAEVHDELESSQIYINLRNTNPAPFAAIAKIRDATIISSSPERLVKVNNRLVETRPIAGTRPRSDSSEADQKLKQQLIKHPKERAEHIMLIDLERNDLGRVCIPGSIRVNELMTLESYAHVHHIVSNVQGELEEKVTPGEVLRAVFPGGTITGCPKERCMAIIAELEGVGRGAYTGSLGYLNHNGDMDFNILIRTISRSASKLTIRAGAGLVADSDARRELNETRHKARGMLLALQQTAQTGQSGLAETAS